MARRFPNDRIAKELGLQPGRRGPAAKARCDALQRQREALLKEAAALASKIDRADLAAQEVRRLFKARKNRLRPWNTQTLSEALVELLRGRTMRLKDATAAVQKVGYRTNSPTFRFAVNAALLDQTRFRRVGRGRYTAKV